MEEMSIDGLSPCRLGACFAYDDHSPNTVCPTQFAIGWGQIVKMDISDFEKLLEGGKIKVNECDTLGNTLLNHAIKIGNIPIVKKLLEAGSDAQHKNELGHTPLHWGAFYNRLDIVQLLLDQVKTPGYVDSENYLGYTSLHEAVDRENVQIMKILIDNGAKVNISTKIDVSPLYTAARKGSLQCCRTLLENNADVNMLTKNGENALFAVIRYEKRTTKATEKKMDDNLAKDGSGQPPEPADSTNSNSQPVDVASSSSQPVSDTANTSPTSNSNPISSQSPEIGDNVIQVIDLLIENKIDIKCKNKNGITPIKLAKSLNRQKIVTHLLKTEQEMDLIKLLDNKEGVKMDLVKLYLCGNGNVGKSTLKRCLQMSKVEGRVKGPIDEPHNPTPGIDIKTVKISSAGKFSVWDMAGQPEFYVTHMMFLDASEALFIVMYKIADATNNVTLSDLIFWEESVIQLKAWLSFIKAANGDSSQKPKVLIVASHGDLLRSDEKESNRQKHKRLVDKMKQTFRGHLKIQEESFVLDCRSRCGHGDVMDNLCKKLKMLRKASLDGAQKIPALCKHLLKERTKWCLDGTPAMHWNNYEKAMKKFNHFVDVELLKGCTRLLHQMGEILLIEEKVVILNPQWLCSQVFGKLFRGPGFEDVTKRKQVYTRKDIQAIFTDQNVDCELLIELLMHFDLCTSLNLKTNDETDETEFIIPSLLPPNLDPNVWKKSDIFTTHYGRVFVFTDVAGVLPPSFFKRLQVRLMKLTELRGPEPVVCSRAIKFAHCDVQALVRLSATEEKPSVQVLVRLRSKAADGQGHCVMQAIRGCILGVRADSCPGLQLEERLLSPQCLKEVVASDPREILGGGLDRVMSYSVGSVEQAAVKGEKCVYQRGRGDNCQDKITDLLPTGYDTTILSLLKDEADIDWMLHQTRSDLARILALDNAEGRGCFKLAEQFGMNSEEIESIRQDRRDAGDTDASMTEMVLDRWQRQARGQEINTIKSLKTHLYCCNRIDVVTIIDKMLTELE